MKKRFLTLAMALALCLSLAAPALASDVSGLDVATALAYYRVLSEEIQNQGIRDNEKGRGIAYAGLVDMDADGTPELIILGFGMDWVMNIGIWFMKNGTAVQTFGDSFATGAENGRVAFARKNGQIRLFYDYYWSYRMYEGRNLALIAADGTCESSYYINEDDSPVASPEDVTYDKTWVVDSTPILKVENSLQWNYSASQHQAVTALQSALAAQATKAAQSTTPTGGYGPYVIIDPNGFYTMSFDTAKVEKTTVQIRNKWIISSGEYTEPYQNRNVTLVTLKSGSNISISLLTPVGEVMDVEHQLTQDGDGKYTYTPAAIDCIGDDFNTGMLTTDGEILKNELKSGPVSIETGNENYIIAYETAPTYSVSTPSAVGFTDVKADAYYSNAVKWAVGKGITTGTSATKFSPDNTCNNAEILTFLWRAKGQPEPGISNPFRNVKTGDYYYKAALWAYQNGMVSGSTFNATVPCTRSMAVTYLWKAAGSPAAGGSSFSDVPAGASYAQAVAWAVNKGITNGDGGNAFSPNKTCTRGQIVTFLYRAFA